MFIVGPGKPGGYRGVWVLPDSWFDAGPRANQSLWQP